MVQARILLVEDDEVLQQVIRRNLVARGHSVSIAADARRALDYLHRQQFDLVFLDINLPDQTGWGILRALETGKHFLCRVQGSLPVVVLSAVRISPQRLAEFHPLAYLPKPFPIEAILRLAAEAAQRRTFSDQYEGGPLKEKTLYLQGEEYYA